MGWFKKLKKKAVKALGKVGAMALPIVAGALTGGIGTLASAGLGALVKQAGSDGKKAAAVTKSVSTGPIDFNGGGLGNIVNTARRRRRRRRG
jgi:hypothetical protein